jgi:hypothetical protein
MEGATRRIIAKIRQLRRENRAAYAILEDDHTMDLVARFYAAEPDRAKEWHRRILENDAKILELSRKLCE